MEQRLVRKILRIDGMTCTGCEMRIESALKKLEGMVHTKVIFSSSNVYVTYDANKLSLYNIIETIESLDYKVKNKPEGHVAHKNGSVKTAAVTNGNIQKKLENQGKLTASQFLGIGIIVLVLYLVIKSTVGFKFIPEIDRSMGYGLLVVTGLLTSLHCIAMCGGINLSQCVYHKSDVGTEDKLSMVKPSLLYNSGRIISYTVIGGMAGALGSAVIFPGRAKGIVAIISGVYMVIIGFNMLNIFPGLKKLTPRISRISSSKIHGNRGGYGPFYIGLLNGLMPCGPLQAMQIYALGTGSLTAGALSMFLFGLGTVPLLLGFGAVGSLLGGKFTHKMVKAGAMLVIILGLVTANRGLALSGINITFASAPSGNIAKIEGNVQVVTTKLEPGSYPPIIVQKGIPVKWTIKADAEDLNGCNNPVTIPEYNIWKELIPGDNIIEFTPDKEGNIVYTCWMGMIRSNIKVVSDISKVSDNDLQGMVHQHGSGWALLKPAVRPLFWYIIKTDGA